MKVDLQPHAARDARVRQWRWHIHAAEIQAQVIARRLLEGAN